MLNKDTIYYARVYMESTSPLAIASGIEHWNEDKPVLLDANGLPYIPGTSIAGFLRSSFQQLPNQDQVNLNLLFGFQQGEQGSASKFYISSGHVCYQNKGIEGLVRPSFLESQPLFKKEDWKIKRDRVRINDKGVVDASGKFDASAVIKGMRFVFDIRLFSEEEDADSWQALKDLLGSPSFRLGGGTTNGFGRFKLIKLEERLFKHSEPSDIEAYCNFSGAFEAPIPGATIIENLYVASHLKEYALSLKPRDFFIFQESGRAIDGQADMRAKMEVNLKWNEQGEAKIGEQLYLLPASSVKGALAHRTLFHYNKLKGIFADTSTIIENHEGKRHSGINRLFGEAKDSRAEREGSKGLLIFNDVYLKPQAQKLERISHVSLDPLTQGAKSGALFSEEPLNKAYQLETSIYLEPAEDLEQVALDAFHLALNDLCEGRLALGGGTNRGHGIFTGTIKEN